MRTIDKNGNWICLADIKAEDIADIDLIWDGLKEYFLQIHPEWSELPKIEAANSGLICPKCKKPYFHITEDGAAWCNNSCCNARFMVWDFYDLLELYKREKFIAEFIYKFLHNDTDWANHTVLPDVPLMQRDMETRRRYFNFAKALVENFGLRIKD